MIIQQPAGSHEPIACAIISRIAPCDTGGADIIVHGGMHGLTLEKDVA